MEHIKHVLLKKIKKTLNVIYNCAVLPSCPYFLLFLFPSFLFPNILSSPRFPSPFSFPWKVIAVDMLPVSQQLGNAYSFNYDERYLMSLIC